MNCAWCIGLVDVPAMTCVCTTDCGTEGCPMSIEHPAGMQPVPSFADGIRQLVEETKPAEYLELDDGPIVDSRAALDRVLALHARCACATCSSGCQKPVCSGCPDFWPCATIRVSRGFTAR